MKHAKELKHIAETQIPEPSKEGIWDMDGPRLLAAKLQKVAKENKFIATVFLEEYVSGALDETDLADALERFGYRVTRHKQFTKGGKVVQSWIVSWGHS